MTNPTAKTTSTAVDLYWLPLSVRGATVCDGTAESSRRSSPATPAPRGPRPLPLGSRSVERSRLVRDRDDPRMGRHRGRARRRLSRRRGPPLSRSISFLPIRNPMLAQRQHPRRGRSRRQPTGPQHGRHSGATHIPSASRPKGIDQQAPGNLLGWSLGPKTYGAEQVGHISLPRQGNVRETSRIMPIRDPPWPPVPTTLLRVSAGQRLVATVDRSLRRLIVELIILGSWVRAPPAPQESLYSFG
jgi:hypothetical protein